ncbi:hypothetical protein [Trichothermofontia sp.]
MWIDKLPIRHPDRHLQPPIALRWLSQAIALWGVYRAYLYT